MSAGSLWQRFNAYFYRDAETGFTLDVSRVRFTEEFWTGMEPLIQRAFTAMSELEAGAISNPDEQRMVGHYWLRNASLAPAELQAGILSVQEEIKAFARAVHNGEERADNGAKFTDVLLVGIGGSALGPQLVADALGTPQDPLRISFLDNTDPDGIDRVLAELAPRLATTLVLVISKSGGTKETRNGMLEVEAAYNRAGLKFGPHVVAITGVGSALDQHAQAQGWLRRFPMEDWVGGRTSVMSAVGLLPAALHGADVDAFLAGAAKMDELTRVRDAKKNPAMLLALMWHFAGGGKGGKDMVILPYKDRLVLMSKYLQQLVMESLGKELDLDGNKVNQGIAVYGNKGSTDQHAYVQQLRDGVNNFFATFIEVRRARDGDSLKVEEGFATGDYLQGFLRGTRRALYEGGRDSVTLSIPRVDAFYLGLLVALFERAVGFYASLVNINAYHQPGVEAGKKAAGEVLSLQSAVLAALEKSSGPQCAETVANSITAEPEAVYHVLCHLAENDIRVKSKAGTKPVEDTFWLA